MTLVDKVSADNQIICDEIYQYIISPYLYFLDDSS